MAVTIQGRERAFCLSPLPPEMLSMAIICFKLLNFFWQLGYCSRPQPPSGNLRFYGPGILCWTLAMFSYQSVSIIQVNQFLLRFWFHCKSWIFCFYCSWGTVNRTMIRQLLTKLLIGVLFYFSYLTCFKIQWLRIILFSGAVVSRACVDHLIPRFMADSRRSRHLQFHVCWWIKRSGRERMNLYVWALIEATDVKPHDLYRWIS